MRLLLLACAIATLRSCCALAVDVAIDIGHSQSHPGARGVPEFRLNRELALVIDRELRKASFSTLLVGADGDIDELAQRTQLAADASFFLSIHHDSVQPRSRRCVNPKRVQRSPLPLPPGSPPVSVRFLARNEAASAPA
jgi:N-acetylmuramoyl-L-alanine amidase